MLNALFTASWPAHRQRDFSTLSHSLGYVGAFVGDALVGFVNIAWDGDQHAFILDTTVHPEHRRKGIGRRLVEEAVEVCRERGIVWVHVDFEPALADFYIYACGFAPSAAGVMRLRAD